MDDWELLQAYVKGASHDAFASIVRRYLNLVYSAANRRVGDRHLAEDVTQAVFLVLARRAGDLSRDTRLASWLLTTTRYACNDMVKIDSRRAAREHAAAQSDSVTAVQPDITIDLEDAMSQLPADERDLLVMRFYQSHSLREVGIAIGVSEEAAKKRIHRAVDHLRDLLNRRGVTALTVAAIATALTLEVEAAPAALTKEVIAVIRTASTPSISQRASAGSHKSLLTSSVCTIVLLAGLSWLWIASPVQSTQSVLPATQPASFMLVNRPGQTCSIDLDTQTLHAMPADVMSGGALQWAKWAGEKGVDLTCMVNPRQRVLQTWDCQITLADGRTLPANSQVTVPQDLPMIFHVQTRENGAWKVEILDVSPEDRTITLTIAPAANRQAAAKAE